jgi:hypothetical protein
MTIRKHVLFFAAITLLSSSYSFAFSTRQDMVEILRNEGIEQQVKDAIPGNNSTAYINEAYVELNDTGMKAYVHFFVDAQQEACVRIPFVGKRCVTTWGFETNLAAEAILDPSCNVNHVDVRKWGSSSEGLAHLVEPLIHELYHLFETQAEAMVRKSIEKAIQNNQAIKEFCNL